VYWPFTTLLNGGVSSDRKVGQVSCDSTVNKFVQVNDNIEEHKSLILEGIGSYAVTNIKRPMVAMK